MFSVDELPSGMACFVANHANQRLDPKETGVEIFEQSLRKRFTHLVHDVLELVNLPQRRPLSLDTGKRASVCRAIIGGLQEQQEGVLWGHTEHHCARQNAAGPKGLQGLLKVDEGRLVDIGNLGEYLRLEASHIVEKKIGVFTQSRAVLGAIIRPRQSYRNLKLDAASNRVLTRCRALSSHAEAENAYLAATGSRSSGFRGHRNVTLHEMH